MNYQNEFQNELHSRDDFEKTLKPGLNPNNLELYYVKGDLGIRFTYTGITFRSESGSWFFGNHTLSIPKRDLKSCAFFEDYLLLDLKGTFEGMLKLHYNRGI